MQNWISNNKHTVETWRTGKPYFNEFAAGYKVPRSFFWRTTNRINTKAYINRCYTGRAKHFSCQSGGGGDGGGEFIRIANNRFQFNYVIT